MLTARIADLTIGQGLEIYAAFVVVGFIIAGIIAVCVAFSYR